MDLEKRIRIMLLVEELSGLAGNNYNETDYVRISGSETLQRKLCIKNFTYAGSKSDDWQTVMKGLSIRAEGTWQDTIEDYLKRWLEAKKFVFDRTIDNVDVTFPTDNWLDRTPVFSDEHFLWLMMTFDNDRLPQVIKERKDLRFLPIRDERMFKDGYYTPIEYEGSFYGILQGSSDVYVRLKETPTRLTSIYSQAYSSMMKIIERGYI